MPSGVLYFYGLHLGYKNSAFFFRGVFALDSSVAEQFTDFKGQIETGISDPIQIGINVFKCGNLVYGEDGKFFQCHPGDDIGYVTFDIYINNLTSFSITAGFTNGTTACWYDDEDEYCPERFCDVDFYDANDKWVDSADAVFESSSDIKTWEWTNGTSKDVKRIHVDITSWEGSTETLFITGISLT